MIKLKKKTHLELNEAYNKVLHWFFSFPTRQIGLNDLSGELGISKTTAKSVVLMLKDEGFLILEVIGNAWRIYCNPEHNYNFTRKISHNLSLVYESQILYAIHDIIRNPLSVILFGSYRKGDDNEKSDLDIAVEILGDEGLKIHKLGILPDMGFRKNVQVNLHIFSRNKIDLNLFSNIANGIILEGFLEVRP